MNEGLKNVLPNDGRCIGQLVGVDCNGSWSYKAYICIDSNTFDVS